MTRLILETNIPKIICSETMLVIVISKDLFVDIESNKIFLCFVKLHFDIFIFHGIFHW